MAKPFFGEFATGFFKAGADIQMNKEKQREELDKQRREALLKIEVEKQLYDYKQKKDLEYAQAAKAANPYGTNAINQTPDAITSVPQPTNSSISLTKVTPPGMDEVDDSGVPGMEASQAAGVPPVSEAPPAQVPAPVQLVSNDPNSQLYAPDPKPQDPANDPQIRAKAKVAYDNAIDIYASEGMNKAMGKAREAAEKVYEDARKDSPASKAALAGAEEAAKLKARQDASIVPQDQRQAIAMENKLPDMPSVSLRNDADTKIYGNFHDNAWSGKEAQEAIQNNNKTIALGSEFMKLNKKNPTGGILYAIPYAKEFATTFNSELAQMDSDSKLMVMSSIKSLGSGTAISDSDREFAEKAGLSISKLSAANEARAAAVLGIAQADNDYRSFVQASKAVDADPAAVAKAWREYTNANPVFASTDVKNVQVNKERLTWEEYFDAKRNGTLDEARASAKAKYEQNEGTAEGDTGLTTPKAGEEMDGYTFKGGDPADKNNWVKK